MSVRQLEFSAEAEADLQAILQYTEATWGADQAARYSSDIWKALEQIRAFPNSGKERLDVAEGLRSLPAGQHLVLYMISAQTVRIRRIVHSRSRVARALIREGVAPQTM